MSNLAYFFGSKHEMKLHHEANLLFLVPDIFHMIIIRL